MKLKKGDYFWGHDPGRPNREWTGKAIAKHNFDQYSLGLKAEMMDGTEAYFALDEVFLTEEDFLRALILEAAGADWRAR